MKKPQSNYIKIVETLKDKIRSARLRASYSVNTELINLYWEIGNVILIEQEQDGWG